VIDVIARLVVDAVPVAVRFPPMYAEPPTERVENGEVVAIPKLPPRKIPEYLVVALPGVRSTYVPY